MSPLAASCPIRIAQALAALAVLLLSACGSPEERAQDYYERAVSFVEKNDLPRARIELRNALQNKPDLIPALRALAQIEEREQNWQALATVYRRIAAVDQNDLDVRVRLARFAMLAGAFHDALEWANAAVAINSSHPGAIALHAAILLKLSDEDGATRGAQKALEIESDNIEAFIVLAAARLARGDTNGAMRVLDGISADKKDDVGIALLRVKVYEKQNELERVRDGLRELVERHPQDAALKVQLLQFYLTYKHWDDAERLLRGMEAEQSSTKAGLDIVRFLGEVKGPAAARRELEARIQKGGDVFAYQLALAELDFAQGNAAAGKQTLEALIGNLKAADRIMAARLRLAQMYISIRDFVAAEPQIADILRADTRNVHALRLRAAMRLEQGRIDDAIADLRQALGDQPRSAEVIALLAIAYERNGSIELAEKQFSDAVRILDYAPAAGLEYVAFLKRRGRNRQAEDVLIELARRHPDSAAILTAWAQIRLAQQNWAGASEIADTIRMLKDQSGVADQILASSLSGQKKYDQSAELLTKVYADNPGALPPMFALVRSYVLDRQIDKAEAFLDAVLSASPANSEARVLKGLVQIAGNAPEQAVKSFEAAIEANPRSPAGYRALAELESSRGNYDQALNVLRAGLREQPGSLPLRLAQAGILELSGNVEAAIEQYEILLKEQPGSLVIANNLASLMSEHRKDQASLDRAYVLAKSLAESPLPQFKDTMGWISHLRGDHRRAIALLEEAVAGLPKDPLVRYHLGMSYVAAGQAERGNAELRTAADLVPPGREALTEKIKTAIGE